MTELQNAINEARAIIRQRDPAAPALVIMHPSTMTTLLSRDATQTAHLTGLEVQTDPEVKAGEIVTVRSDELDTYRRARKFGATPLNAARTAAALRRNEHE